ncbi:hypothetical protein COCON_G00190940 [Conger conger]|uniref:Ig-like domain-containing protein n=1 Tax=Conger conger TaxID=82655 RepID=A0A9Q1D3K6_CONCO|nr:hypothetical protein COCON_G00190940 [Conger conger]
MTILPELIFLLLLRIKGAFLNGVNPENGYDTVAAKLGVPLTLKCQHNCTAWTRGSWDLEQAEVSVCRSCFSETKKMDRNGAVCTVLLSLRYVSLNQTHYKYECHSVENDDPSLTRKRERRVLVVVQAPPSAPEVSVTPQGDVRAGRSTGLVCATRGFNPRNVTFTWTFNGSPVAGASEHTVGTNADGTFSAQSNISVTPTAFHHKGAFTCEIQHPALSRPLRASITLDVKYLSLNISYSGSIKSTGEPLRSPHAIRASVGSYLKLSCRVHSNPPTEGQWVRENVAPSRQIGTATTLTLDKVKAEDAGSYSCEASTAYETKRLTVTIEVNSGGFIWFKVLAATMVIVATVLGVAAVYSCLSSRRKKNACQDFTTCNSGTANIEPRVEKPPATGESAAKWEPVAVTFTCADSQSDHEVPYADIMISVRGSSTPELTHIPDPTPRNYRQRWKEEQGSSSLLQVSCSADRLHVHQRDVARKLSTSSEYAVIQYRSEPLS